MMKQYGLVCILCAAWLAAGLCAAADEPPAPPELLPTAVSAPVRLRDLHSETWVGTDGLGRTLSAAGQVRAAQPGKFVGIFYFLVHGTKKFYANPGLYDDPRTVYDNTRILAQIAADPARKGEFYKKGNDYWWGEPAVGYFLSDDAWVTRHNLQMLQNAGVDVLFFDVTNAFTYPIAYMTVCHVAEQMRVEGLKTPQIAFLTNARGGYTVTQLYDHFYAKGYYKDLWFQWEGKPLILGKRDSKKDDGTLLPAAVQEFFTWRYSWAWNPGQGTWPWIDNYPQGFGWTKDAKTPEEAPVAVAGHPTTNIGRSNLGKVESDVDPKTYLAPDVDKGVYFAKQWKRALEIDPQMVFVTGWNEWYAGRGTFGSATHFAGHMAQAGDPLFVDNYNQEFSRDIMPMKGGHQDNYYMQLVEGIREFKGARLSPRAHGFAAIRLTGPWSQWAKVQPQYLDAAGDTQHRDWPGWANARYTNATGRNDITSAKAACDAKSIAFSVHTAAPLTPHTDPHWMQLLIDADQDPKTGWHGYDFVVNSRVVSATVTTLKRLSDGKTWPVPYRAQGNDLQVIIHRTLLGLTDAKNTAFDFHWIDNVPVGAGDIADWWYYGDSAPDGRFNYRYQNTIGVSTKLISRTGNSPLD